MKFYSNIIQENDLVFDIGANLGNRTKVYLGLGARVISVEPNPVLAKKLIKKFPKTNVVEKAIGPNRDEVKLFINDSNVLSTTSEEWIDTVKNTGRFGDLGNKFNQEVIVD
ncbi:hypothetical protein OAQ99_07230 [Candidatus Kapabacteria bacterium]|nr:hypothetical protein [Candidatus Kapabacteria bacterium]